MDALIQEIAKTFNIGNETVQNLIDSYPQLRQQVAYYNVTTTVQAIMFVLGVISFLALVWSGGTAIINAYEHAKPGYGYGYRNGAGKTSYRAINESSHRIRCCVFNKSNHLCSYDIFASNSSN